MIGRVALSHVAVGKVVYSCSSHVGQHHVHTNFHYGIRGCEDPTVANCRITLPKDSMRVPSRPHLIIWHHPSSCTPDNGPSHPYSPSTACPCQTGRLLADEAAHCLSESTVYQSSTFHSTAAVLQFRGSSPGIRLVPSMTEQPSSRPPLHWVRRVSAPDQRPTSR